MYAKAVNVRIAVWGPRGAVRSTWRRRLTGPAATPNTQAGARGGGGSCVMGCDVMSMAAVAPTPPPLGTRRGKHGGGGCGRGTCFLGGVLRAGLGKTSAEPLMADLMVVFEGYMRDMRGDVEPTFSWQMRCVGHTRDCVTAPLWFLVEQCSIWLQRTPPRNPLPQSQ